jgi:hypothetical protein
VAAEVLPEAPPPRPPYLFLRYFAQELRFSSCSLPSGWRVLVLAEGEDWSLSICEERDRANSPPNLDVKGVSISSPSSPSSSSSPPSPIIAELLLFASRAFLSLRAAYLPLIVASQALDLLCYLERPLGYCSSPEILRDADSSGVGSLGSGASAALVRDLAR